MIAAGEDELICDLAETYGVFDMRALPVPLLATLAAGLRPESRIRMKMSGDQVTADTLLMAEAVDSLNLLVWSKTKDAEKGKNVPESLAAKLVGKDKQKKQSGEYETFKSPDDFLAAWKAQGGGT